jgi:molybdopterin converting factor small subunit
MVKVLWNNKNIELQSGDGISIRELVVKYKEYFDNISLNFSPMKVLKRNPISNLPSSCIQVDWDYIANDGDEIEFFAPGGLHDVARKTEI